MSTFRTFITDADGRREGWSREAASAQDTLAALRADHPHADYLCVENINDRSDREIWSRA